MLVSSVPVRLVDVSRGGCRIEVDRHLAAGTHGRLELVLDGLLHLDDVRVCRCQRRQGAGRVFQLGVELLRTRRLSRRSLRLALRRLIGAPDDGRPVPYNGPVSHADPFEAARSPGVNRSPPEPVTVDP